MERDIENQYLDLLKLVLDNGIIKSNRTGTNTITSIPTMIQHDMDKGFPLLTTKHMGIKSVSAELEFFIKGLSDKQWLKDRNCNIWSEWCNPSKIPDGLSDGDRKKFQLLENDLGKVYGYQWRNFNSEGHDQFKSIVDCLKNDVDNRRMVCSAWNPLEFEEMALPPCHVMWGVQVLGGRLNVWWMQRSVDLFLGLPYNLASYALLLKLLAKQSGLKEGILTGFLSDVHIYDNHINQVKEQLTRTPYKLPSLDIPKFTNIYEWEYTDVSLINYTSHPSIKAPIAI